MNSEVRVWDSDRMLSRELERRLNVRMFNREIKFPCGHKCRIGATDKKRCYECVLKEQAK